MDARPHERTMKQFAELVPVILFFLAYSLDGTTVSLAGWEYRFDGFYSATAVMMIAVAAQLVLTRLVLGRVEKRLLWLAAAVFVFGGATLALRNPLFFQWKPTIFNWAMALVFVIVRWRTGSSVAERAMDGQLQLPAEAWLRIDRLWIANFLLVGALNLAVAYSFSEATWVSYKLYSMIGFTVLLSLATVALIAPYLRETGDDPPAGTG
jgi:intracellular septation protein